MLNVIMLCVVMLSVFGSFQLLVTQDTRKNNQPLKSQLAQKSTYQNANLPKSQPENIMTKNLWLMFQKAYFLACWPFGKLSFWKLTISPSIITSRQIFIYVHSFIVPLALSFVITMSLRCNCVQHFGQKMYRWNMFKFRFLKK